MVTHRVSRHAAIVALLLAMSCQSDGLLVPPRNDPFLYIPIGERSSSGGQRALLLNLGAPRNATERLAQQFDITRSQDTARFTWQHVSFPNPKYCGSGCPLDNGNYLLADTAQASSHGFLEIQAGDTLVLTVITDGVAISGMAVVPANPSPVVVMRGADKVIVWPAAAGASRYIVESTVGNVPTVQSDTEFVIPPLRPDRPPGAYDFTVKAVDPNLASYMTGLLLRAGLDNGFGVFGAVGTATITVSLP